VGLFFVCSTA